jgi:hypothetical protein
MREKNDQTLCDALADLQASLPPVFAGTELDRYTGKAYRWRTLQNEKCSRAAPANMFIRSGGKKLLVIRDKFLSYWQKKLRAA